MTLKDQSDIAHDVGLAARVTACAARPGIADPVDWTAKRMWHLAATPGWAQKYADAARAGNKTPGDDDSVITDEMICAAVNDLNGAP